MRTSRFPSTLVRFNRRLFVAFRVWLSFAALAFTATGAWAQAPSITFLSPTGGQRGGTVDVTLNGAGLVGATAVPTDLPITATIPADIPNNGKEAGKVVVRMQIPADATVGIGGLRVVTPKGISNLRLFMIDDLQPVAENGTNKALAQAQ